MYFNLKGRVALVTGGSHGIGKAIALSLAQEEVNVAICGRSLLSLKSVLEEAGDLGEQLDTYVVDATSRHSVDLLFEDLEQGFGKLDILVNNIGGAEKFGSFFDLEDEDWIGAYELNLISMVRFTKKAIPFLRKSNNARIINISSLSGIRPGMFNPHYGASKAAMLNLSKHLANLLAKDGILVNAICPSTLKGGGWDRNVRDRADRSHIPIEEAEALMEAEEKKKNPLGVVGTLDDVADLVTFLVSDRAKFITGSCFRVDGGTVTSIT